MSFDELTSAMIYKGTGLHRAVWDWGYEKMVPSVGGLRWQYLESANDSWTRWPCRPERGQGSDWTPLSPHLRRPRTRIAPTASSTSPPYLRSCGIAILETNSVILGIIIINKTHKTRCVQITCCKCEITRAEVIRPGSKLRFLNADPSYIPVNK